MSHLVLGSSLGLTRAAVYVKDDSGVVVEKKDDDSSMSSDDILQIGSVTIMGTPTIDEWVVSRLASARDVTCIGTEGKSIEILLSVAENMINLRLISCELPRMFAGHGQINLTLEGCYGLSISPATTIAGLSIHCPLLEPLHSTFARDAFVIRFAGMAALRSQSDSGVSCLCPCCVGVIESSQSAHLIGLERICLTGHQLAQIMRKNIQRLSFHDCVLRDWAAFQDYPANASIRHLEISVFTGKSMADSIDVYISRMERLEQLVVRDQFLDEADFRAIATLPISELNIESCGLGLGSLAPVSNVQRLQATSTQMRMYPELRQMFSSAEIEVTEVM